MTHIAWLLGPPALELKAAYVGRQPSIGPFGEQLSPKRARVAKRPMTFSYALTEVRGDWKWHRELWCLKRHYKCKDICHLCFANIYAGPTQYFVCKHITKEYMYIYICVCGLMFVTLRYTQFEEMRNFPRMTVAQWYLLSLKDYINPLCVSWLWIQWCGTKRSSKTWFFSDRSLVMLMRQSQGSVLWWSNIAAAWLNIILHTQRCGKFMSDCFFLNQLCYELQIKSTLPRHAYGSPWPSPIRQCKQHPSVERLRSLSFFDCKNIP